jgi:hypothetical protein
MAAMVKQTVSSLGRLDAAYNTAPAQVPVLRVPLADGTLVASPDAPSEDLIPSP